jgi:hypothetical protein
MAAAGLWCAGTASAHDSNGWYWTERYGALRLERSYADVVDADCLGWGPWRWTRGGDQKFSHLSCGLELDSGTGIQVTVEVLGKRRARVLYNDDTDVIR